MEESETVFIIILLYNNLNYLVTCTHGTHTHMFMPCHVIFVYFIRILQVSFDVMVLQYPTLSADSPWSLGVFDLVILSFTHRTIQ